MAGAHTVHTLGVSSVHRQERSSRIHAFPSITCRYQCYLHTGTKQVTPIIPSKSHCHHFQLFYPCLLDPPPSASLSSCRASSCFPLSVSAPRLEPSSMCDNATDGETVNRLRTQTPRKADHRTSGDAGFDPAQLRAPTKIILPLWHHQEEGSIRPGLRFLAPIDPHQI